MMITKEIVLRLHELSVLYPAVFEKAAAIAESIIINHPFFDGNKRTGYLSILV
ncbi:MAG: Fic family protein [Ferruginibacter sp.]